MAYESPIRLITELENKIIEDQKEGIYKAVLSYQIDISKDELFKLLHGDRKQYEKGFEDGWKERDKSQTRCKGCKNYGTLFGKSYCSFLDWAMNPNDYCSRWERKDGGEND